MKLVRCEPDSLRFHAKPYVDEDGIVWNSEFTFPLELWPKIPDDGEWHKLEWIMTNMRHFYRLDGKVIFTEWLKHVHDSVITKK